VNEDECILCDLCLQRCPTDAIAIHKLYSDEVLTAASLQGSGR
jgi:NAD-dependent dihydropyrimidine dehydrogenase PreA subunit